VEVDRGLVRLEKATVPVSKNISADIVPDAMEAEEKDLTKCLEIIRRPDVLAISCNSKQIKNKNMNWNYQCFNFQ
jgi:hypothetical protein